VEYVLPDNTIFTDDASAYRQLPRIAGGGYEHKRINHLQKVLRNGRRAHEHD